MGSDELFKRRNAQRKQRKCEERTPRANSYLIVTEGARTEPLYLTGIKNLIEQNIGGTINVTSVDSPTIDICGQGASTSRLIDIAEKIVKESKIIYQNIWVVFDKDDFDDFDQAIKEGEAKGYNIAWSNQSFEYWIFLHFNYSDSALHRDVWVDKLSAIFKTYNIKNGKYEKNYGDLYEICDTYGSVKTAIANAKRRMKGFRIGVDKPSQYDPGTTIHMLVSELLTYLKG